MWVLEGKEGWGNPETYLERVLYPGPRMRSHVAFHPYQRFHLRVQPVAHQLELAVGRDEADGPVVLEPRQPHALMELDVFHLDSFSPRRPPRRLEHDLVVQAQPQLRHAAEIAFEFDRAEDFAAEDVSC